MNKKIVAEPQTKRDQTRARLLQEIKTGLKEVKAIREGKAPSHTMSDLLNNI